MSRTLIEKAPEAFDECSICKEQFENQENCLFECGHYFHEECSMEWYTHKNTCPLCRASFVPAFHFDKLGSSMPEPGRWEEVRRIHEERQAEDSLRALAFMAEIFPILRFLNEMVPEAMPPSFAVVLNLGNDRIEIRPSFEEGIFQMTREGDSRSASPDTPSPFGDREPEVLRPSSPFLSSSLTSHRVPYSASPPSPPRDLRPLSPSPVAARPHRLRRRRSCSRTDLSPRHRCPLSPLEQGGIPPLPDESNNNLNSNNGCYLTERSIGDPSSSNVGSQQQHVLEELTSLSKATPSLGEKRGVSAIEPIPSSPKSLEGPSTLQSPFSDPSSRRRSARQPAKRRKFALLDDDDE